MTLKVRRQWDRLEALFILWEPMILFFWPFRHHLSAYSADRHCPSNMFSTVNCCNLFQRILRGRPSLGSIRSNIASLYICMNDMKTLYPLSEVDFCYRVANRSLMALGTMPSD